jgi:hypothetical protein
VPLAVHRYSGATHVDRAFSRVDLAVPLLTEVNAAVD